MFISYSPVSHLYFGNSLKSVMTFQLNVSTGFVRDCSVVHLVYMALAKIFFAMTFATITNKIVRYLTGIGIFYVLFPWGRGNLILLSSNWNF